MKGRSWITAFSGRARRRRLMTERELRSVFPRGRIWRERVAWMTKSLVVYGGWESDSLRE